MDLLSIKKKQCMYPKLQLVQGARKTAVTTGEEIDKTRQQRQKGGYRVEPPHTRLSFQRASGQGPLWDRERAETE